MNTAASFRPRRRTALISATALAAMALGGCQINSPVSTLLPYTPGDGIDMDGGSLAARDILVVSQGDGAPGVVSGSLINEGAEPQTVTVSVNGTSVGDVTVAPHSLTRLDGVTVGDTAGTPTTVPAVETPAGQSVEVRFQVGSDTLAANVPVLLPQGIYADLADQAGGTVEPGN